eukprot:COSAG06_NODE_14123_length_1187_cov_2.634191_1_plen_44_part_10
MVRMRFQWGDLHSIYETRAESLFEGQTETRNETKRNETKRLPHL